MSCLNKDYIISLEKRLIKTTHFSEVYELIDPRNETNYCLKSISKSAPKPHTAQKELKIMKLLDENKHKNIIQLLSSWDTLDDIHLIMPFEKETLAEILIPYWKPVIKKKNKSYLSALLHTSDPIENSDKITEQDFFINTTPKELTLKITSDLFEGMSYLAQQGIIHRDLKLDNILYSPIEKNFIIIDFGISCFVVESSETDDEQNFQSDDGITDIATGYYKPIEALLGIKKYDTKVDVWSGMVLLQQLSLEFVCCYNIPVSCYYEAFKETQKNCNNSFVDVRKWIDFICKKKLDKNDYELKYNHNTIKDYNFPSMISDGRVYFDDVLCEGSDIKLLSSIHSIFGCPLQIKFPSAKGINSWLYFFNNLDNPSEKYFLDDLERKLFIKKLLFNKFNDNDEFIEKCLFKMCLFEFKDRISYKECLDVFNQSYSLINRE